jgi:tetratricopeptide (TPR) repeat protein
LSILRRLVCAALLVFAIARAEPSRAEDPRTAAAGHYARGIDLAAQGLYAAALEQFNAAYTASPHFAVLYNIGQSQMALGRPLEAIEALSKYLRDGADQVPLSRREQVQAQIGLLESRLAELSITVDRVGAVVRVDGRDVGSTPLFQPIRLAAGAHTVTVSIPNGPQLTRDVPLRESERQTVALTFGVVLRPAASTAGISEASDTSPLAGPLILSASAGPPREPWYFHGKTMRRMAYVLTGVGVLCAGTAVGVYLANRGKYDDWKTGNAALQGDMMGSAAYMAQAASNNALASSLSDANHAIVGLSIAGGVLAAAGVTLFFVDRAHRRETGQLSFGVGDRSANVGWRWTW